MASTMFKLGLFSLVFWLVSFPTESAVLSIDLGSEWLKVAVVNLKPGQTPISVAINEMSKRKTPALVSFQSGERLIGEEAHGLVARYPDKVFSRVRDMLGKPLTHVKNFLNAAYLPFQIVEDSRGAVGIKIDDGATVYSAEELTAMILSYAKNLAEVHSKVSIKDAVVTVPPYFGQAERKGLLQAAQLAGLNVLSLINEHSGAALQYGIDKDFSNGSRHVIFYDMGATSTYAALVYFSAYSAKEYGKTVSVNQFQVKDVRWDPELGGQNMESRLVEYFADEFNKQMGGKMDVRKSSKAMAKLKKQVKRTKEILSANTVAPISVESLYEDNDFRSTITREKFEALCEDRWEKSLVPVKEVLKYSGLKIEDIYAVELIGGATRVPKLQIKLQEFIARGDLDKHLDADEAIVLGSALHAANLSDGIKLNRKLGMVDGSSYGLVVEFHGPDLSKDDSKQLLVQRMKKLPSKMFRSVVHDKDFEVSLAYESEGLLPPGVSASTFAHYAVTGLTNASEKYASRNLSSPIKANLHFSLSRSSILYLDRADAVIEVSEWVEVPKANATLENLSGTSNMSVKGGSQNTSQQSNESTPVGGVGSASNSSLNEQNSPDLDTEKKLKKRTFRISLKIVEKVVSSGMSLSKESLTEAKRKLDALDKKDADRKRTAELKNNLEGYIYATREKLEASEEIKKVSTIEERHFFIEQLEEAQEWLYTDGEEATANEFQERLDALNAIGNPIFFRLKELTARPVASEHAQSYLHELQQVVRGWESNKPWLPRERIDEVLNDAEKLKNWLAEKESQQKATSGTSTPVFTSEEIYDKVIDLQDKVKIVDRIPKPKPKVEKPKRNETEEDNMGNSTHKSTSRPQPEESSKPASQENINTSEDTSGKAQPHDEL